MNDAAAQFRWHGACAVGSDVPQTGTSPHLHTIHALRRAIQSGQSLSLQDSTVTSIIGTKGQLQCQTGGSTGKPKTIIRSHQSWIASFEINQSLFALTDRDCVAVFGGLQHSLTAYAVIEAAHIGADISILAGLRPNRQIAAIIANSVTYIYVTPTQLKLLLSAKTPAPTLRHIIVGGGALTEDVIKDCARTFKQAKITQFYGASETSFITLTGSTTPKGSVGRAYPNVTLKLLDAQGQETTDTGEVWVKSPYLFEDYGVGQSSDILRKDGFVTVGELGRMDEHGNLFLLGRRSRMITIADQNVFPEEIENYIAQTFRPAHVVVMAEEDPLRGHRLVAIIQGTDFAMDDIKQACRDTFGPLIAPRRVLQIKDMPVLTSGKPDFLTLKTWLETHQWPARL